MSYFLSDEQEMIRDTARRFAREKVEPIANKIDREDCVPDSLYKAAADLNFYALFVPEEYGGLGQNLTTACIVLEEIAKASPAYAGVLSVEMVLCPAAIALAGTEEQKQRILVPVARGETVLAWSMTEAAGGANIAHHQARITADESGYRIDGVKLFCSQGRADTILFLAKTNVAGQEGYGCVLVDKNSAGVQPAAYESKLGWRGTNTGAISYNNVHVPAKNVLGNLLTGMGDLWGANLPSFIAHSATSVGCAQGIFEKTVAYAKEKTLYGKPLYDCQPAAYVISESFATIEAMRSLLYTTALRYDTNKRDPIMGAVCKAWICDQAFLVTSKLLQLWGGHGIMDSTGVNRYMRDARTNMVAEGPSELHYDIIGSSVLGKPTAWGMRL
jgi:alkylation response protein AidB-like acyl-CoA dehydrogenase